MSAFTIQWECLYSFLQRAHYFSFFGAWLIQSPVALMSCLVLKGPISFSFHLTSSQITNGECDESSQGHIEGKNKLSPSLRSFLQVFYQNYRISFFFGLLLIDIILLPMLQGRKKTHTMTFLNNVLSLSTHSRCLFLGLRACNHERNVVLVLVFVFWPKNTYLLEQLIKQNN
jgi:hypothetical protein